jgi:hypothetical protein
MGTRCLTRVFKDDQEILCIYRQFEGYPSGHGVELAKFTASRPFVNGIGENNEVFNGMGCYAAQLVSHLKGNEAGGIYIYAPGSTDVWEEYVYEVRGESTNPSNVSLAVFAAGDEAALFKGDAAGLIAYCRSEA